MRTFLTTLALVAAIAFAGSSLAYACDDCPCEKGAANADAKVTATKSPVHSMMKWVASQVAPKAECGCPSSAEGEKAWRAWYAAEGGALADLRTAMKKDGWTADRTIGALAAGAAMALRKATVPSLAPVPPTPSTPITKGILGAFRSLRTSRMKQAIRREYSL